MASHMVIQVALCAEGLATAKTTYERALLSVHHLMNLQVVSFAKRLATAWKGALVGMLTRVQVHMGLESISAVESLTAAAKGAVKNLFLFPDASSAKLLRFLLKRISWHLLSCWAVSDHNLNFKNRSTSYEGVVRLKLDSAHCSSLFDQAPYIY